MADFDNGGASLLARYLFRDGYSFRVSNVERGNIMTLIQVLQAFEKTLKEQGFPTNYDLVDKEKGRDYAIINYEQPDTGTELEIHMCAIQNRADLAVVHLYGYGRGIDLV